MFQGAKRRITEGARRARIVTVGGSGSGSGNQGGQQAGGRGNDSQQQQDFMPSHVMDLMMDGAGLYGRTSNLMSNGKGGGGGPSSSNVGGSGGPNNAYFVDDEINNDIDMDFLDYGERMGSGDRYLTLAAEESFFADGGIGLGRNHGSSLFNWSSRGLRSGHGGGNREPVDKVVHTDFFNKFDDLLDMDDLS